MRDYWELMDMTPAELITHALECAKLGVLSTALVEALAHQLDTADAEAVQAERLREELEEETQRRVMWQEECRALQRQMEKTYG